MSSHNVFNSVHCNIIKSMQKCLFKTEEIYRNVYFTRWWVISPSTNSQAREMPLIVSPRLLIQYIRRYPPYLEAFSSRCNIRTRHTVPKGPNSQGNILYWLRCFDQRSDERWPSYGGLSPVWRFWVSLQPSKGRDCWRESRHTNSANHYFLSTN